jgi:hypothetical protein
MIKVKIENGMVKGIMLPGKVKQQVTTQYADNTSFTLLEEEGTIRRAIYTLDTLCISSGLILNWIISCGY